MLRLPELELDYEAARAGGNRQPTARRGTPPPATGSLPLRREMAPRGRARSAAGSPPPPPGRPRRHDHLLSDGWRRLAGAGCSPGRPASPARGPGRLPSRPGQHRVRPRSARPQRRGVRRVRREVDRGVWAPGCGFDPIPVGCFCLGRQVNAAGDPLVGAFSRAGTGRGETSHRRRSISKAASAATKSASTATAMGRNLPGSPQSGTVVAASSRRARRPRSFRSTRPTSAASASREARSRASSTRDPSVAASCPCRAGSRVRSGRR